MTFTISPLTYLIFAAAVGVLGSLFRLIAILQQSRLDGRPIDVSVVRVWAGYTVLSFLFAPFTCLTVLAYGAIVVVRSRAVSSLFNIRWKMGTNVNISTNGLMNRLTYTINRFGGNDKG